MKSEAKDYLAIINVGYGGGSWCRDKNKDEAIKRCAMITKSDWKHLFKIPETVKGTVYDVTGYDDLLWDDFGFFVKNTGEDAKKYTKIEVEKLKPEKFEYSYPTKGRKKK